MKRLLNIVLPLLGLAVACVWVFISERPTPAAPPQKEPASSDFTKTIAGSGIIESSSQNIAVMPQIAGNLVAVLVKEGEYVRRGQTLYQLDDRDLRPQCDQAAGAVDQANAALATAQAQLIQARTAIDVAVSNQHSLEASFADLDTQARANAALYKQGIVSYIANNTSTRAAEAAERRVSEAREQADEARQQVRIDEAQIAQARANLTSNQAHFAQLKVELSQMRVSAPMDAQVLQVNSYPGESVMPGQATPPVLLGNTDILEVRVDIDETSAASFKPGSPAIAHLRGKSSASFPLIFYRTEPYVVPRTELTGNDTERVDVRVLQVLYRFKPPPFPVYVGQQVDVFISSVGL